MIGAITLGFTPELWMIRMPAQETGEEAAAGPGDWVHAPVVEGSWTDFESVYVSAPSEEVDPKKILYASKTLAGVTVQMEDDAPIFSARSFSMEARRRSPRIRNSSPANCPRSF